jgi:NADH-quinone oxidoreductase subunit I
MAVTLRNFAGSYFEKDRLTTVQYIIKSEDKKPDCMGKPQFYPAVFDIDISVCMSCQICVEVCPFEAIKMDKVFELSTRERFDALLQRKGELSKSNTYYHSIHPVEAA